MREYIVRFPIVGVISFCVEAESKEQAIEKAWEVEWRLNTEGEAEIDTLEMVEHVTEGNVCHAPQNRIEVDEA